jgi:hypothetical protein
MNVPNPKDFRTEQEYRAALYDFYYGALIQNPQSVAMDTYVIDYKVREYIQKRDAFAKALK